MKAPYWRTPGTHPAEPVVSGSPPADGLCCWSYRVPRDGRPPYWELKFIHAACRVHGKLPAA